MNSIVKTLSRSIREYKKTSILTPLLVTVEVVLECAIPFVIANLVNQMQAGCSMDVIVRYGAVLLVMAVISLIFGGAAGATCANASAGFARNLRKDMFYKIQDYSFENIDKFSVSSLVTRLTTDISNVQLAYMMIIRVAVRCPLMLVFSFAMGFIMGGRLAMIFLFTIPLLLIGLLLVIRAATPLFRRVFRKYDALNDSVQENVQAMRVVKSYVREDYEKKKFAAAAENVQRDFTKAERIMALNGPMMQFCVYAGMVFVMSYGSYTVITTMGLDLNVGQMSSMLTYSFQILMSLMMLSMVFTIITMSQESAERIVEVLSEESTLTSPAGALTEVRDGSVDFDHVSFKYSKKAERNALSDIDLHIKSGEVIGILGGTGSAQPGGRGAAEERAVLGHHQGQPALGQPQRHRRRDGGGLPPGPGRRVHPAVPPEIRHLDRAGRLQRFGRPETAPVHRPRPAEEAQDPDPGRLHQRGGHPHRRPDPPGFPEVHPRDHQDHHRPAGGQRPGRRPHRHDGGRPHRRHRHPRPADAVQRRLPRAVPHPEPQVQ